MQTLSPPPGAGVRQTVGWRLCHVKSRAPRTAVIVAASRHPADPDDAPSTSYSQVSSWISPCSRRHAALGTAVALATVVAGGDAAHAIRTVTLRDGSEVAAAEHGMALAIVALRGSLPQQVALEFKGSLGKYCGFTLDQRAQLADIFKELSDVSGANKRSAGLADVVTLGDAWLGPAVARRLLQPIPGAESSRWFRSLPPPLRQLGRRDAEGRPDPKGAVYGAPYRWGCTLIAYRRDRLLRRGGRPVLDWADLLQPQLEGRLAWLDDPRELLAAALRSLGPAPAAAAAGAGRGGARGRGWVSVNASAAELAAAGLSEEELTARVSALRRQVRLFSSRDHVRALQAGDVWAVVGYSQDLVQLAERSGNIELVAPLSGTQLWADVWAVPAGAQGGHRRAGPSPLLPVWIEYTVSPGRVMGQPGLKGGAPAALLPASAPAAGATPGPADPAAADLLFSIRAHRDHLLASRAAAEAQRRGHLSAALSAGLAGLQELPLLRQLLPPRGDPSDPRVGPAPPEEGHEPREQALGGGAGMPHDAPYDDEKPYPAVELRHANGYLPPPAVLARSEFLLPPDAATLEMYRRVLAAASAAS